MTRREAIHGSAVVQPDPHVAWIEIDGEGVLFDERSGALHVLNPMGMLLWQCLDGSATLSEIAADCAAVFDVDLARARRQVLELARDLSELGLIDSAPARTLGAEAAKTPPPDGPSFLDEPPDT